MVRDPPPGSLALVLQMLHVLTEAAVPPPPLVDACLHLHQQCGDARALVPALRGLDRAAALRLLPPLLELQPEQLRPALARLVAPLPAAQGGEAAAPPPPRPPPVSPEELLSALHLLDAGRDPALLRRSMQAVTVAISSPQLFPPEALAACISQLLTRVPLPQLFMRTVIQTVAAAPHLRNFVAGILRQARWVARGGSAARPWLAARLLWLPPAALLMTLLPRPLLPPAAGGQASVEGRDAVEGLAHVRAAAGARLLPRTAQSAGGRAGGGGQGAAGRRQAAAGRVCAPGQRRDGARCHAGGVGPAGGAGCSHRGCPAACRSSSVNESRIASESAGKVGQVPALRCM